MKRTTKYMTVTTAAAVMLLGSFSVSYAATGWVQTTVDKEVVWSYYDNSGKMIKDEWFQSPSSKLWYYFDEDGVMVTGWGYDKAEGYWFDASGAMATGWREISLEDDDTYGPGSGSSDKGYFYFGTSGLVNEGWTRIGDDWYYLNDGYVDDFEDYQMVYGEVEIEGDEYYFGESTDGSMTVGLVKVISEENSNTPSSKTEESYYLYGSNGVRVLDGWGKYNGVWYYVNDEGEIVTDGFLALDKNDNQVDIDSNNVENVYYMDTKGVMKTGWLELGEDKEVRPGVTKGKAQYYFSSNGIMATGWLKSDGKWYYLSPSQTSDYERGQMVTGLYEMTNADGSGTGKFYYFNTNGEMATSTWKEVEDNNGSDRSIYLDEDGIMVKAADAEHLAFKRVRSKWYIFDTQGYCLEDKGTLVIKSGEGYKVYNGTLESLPTNTEYYEITTSGVARGPYKK